AVLRHSRMSAYKAREVLDLIRGEEVARAAAVLRFCERDAATVVAKLLASAVANAENNDSISPEELYISSCYADEGTTIKRWRPRARGRATRIRKRTCHITVVVSRLPEDRLRQLRARVAAEQAERRRRRVAGGRRAERRRAASASAGAGPGAGAETPLSRLGSLVSRAAAGPSQRTCPFPRTPFPGTPFPRTPLPRGALPRQRAAKWLIPRRRKKGSRWGRRSIPTGSGSGSPRTGSPGGSTTGPTRTRSSRTGRSATT
ncbi:MAG: 50S ribosomal protein L22, partial [Acidimicrobiales bacterium]